MKYGRAGLSSPAMASIYKYVRLFDQIKIQSINYSLKCSHVFINFWMAKIFTLRSKIFHKIPRFFKHQMTKIIIVMSTPLPISYRETMAMEDYLSSFSLPNFKDKTT